MNKIYNMWKLKFEYGCWYAEGQLGQQIWSKDRSQLEKLLEAAGYEHKSVSAYEQSSRGGNLAKYKENHPNINPKEDFTQKAQETFDSYSKQFMKGEQ